MTSFGHSQHEPKSDASVRPEDVYPRPPRPKANPTDTIQWAFKVLGPFFPRDVLISQGVKGAVESGLQPKNRHFTPEQMFAAALFFRAHKVQSAAHDALDRAQVPRRVRNVGGREYDVVHLADGGPPFYMCNRCGWYSHDKESNDQHMKECHGNRK